MLGSCGVIDVQMFSFVQRLLYFLILSLPYATHIRLNQCVGELNYKYFMFFLITNGAFFWYGAYLIFYVLVSPVSPILFDSALWHEYLMLANKLGYLLDLRARPAERNICQPTDTCGEISLADSACMMCTLPCSCTSWTVNMLQQQFIVTTSIYFSF